MKNSSLPRTRSAAALLLLVVISALPLRAVAFERSEIAAARQSIDTTEIRQMVGALADDTFEGREAGSRGGRAAGIYIIKFLKKYGVHGGGPNGSFYQTFSGNCANILAVLDGFDPQLKNQYVVLGAHYDHVGYGSRSNSYGPIGLIHHGADDNASGVAGLLEVIGALSRLPEHPKRSILFAFWDGEEKGLWGSQHWIQNPTVPLRQVPLMINVDMIGRLRNNYVEVSGSRSTQGLRRTVSQQNDLGLNLDFTWEMKDNSDHWSFYSRQIPILMLHTGLHGDYHRPSDEADRVNCEGLCRVGQLLFGIALAEADEPSIAPFRSAALSETPQSRAVLEQPLPPLPGRFGVWWDDRASAAGQGIAITKVVDGSPAMRAGLKAKDRIVRLAGQAITSPAQFRALVLAARNPVSLQVERSGETQPLELSVQLTGNPLRLGLSWREDDAEPGSLIVNRVVPGSPADLAGIHVRDRVYQVAGHDFRSGSQFAEFAAQAKSPIELLVESSGRERTATIHLPDEQPAEGQSADEHRSAAAEKPGP